MPTPAARSRETRGSIGLFGAIAIGVGGMVGGGIFAVLGEAVSVAGGATPEAFMVAGTIALLTAHAYARLSVRYRSAGGTVVFVSRAFPHELLAGSLNVVLWASYLVTIALYASAFGSYAGTFVGGEPGPWVSHALVSLAIVLPAAINLLSPSVVSRSETVVVVIKLVLLAVVIVTGAFYVEPQRLAPSTFGGAGSIVIAGLVIFVAYEGFELIANAAEDVRDPDRNLPRAFMITVASVLILYVLIAIVVVGTVEPAQLEEASDYAMAVAAEPALGAAGFTLVAVAALLATLSAINATIYGNARLGFILAREGELPHVRFGKVVSETKMEVVATVLLSLAIANGLDLSAIAIIGSASFLLVFAAVNMSAFRLHAEIGGLRVVFALGALACVGALVALLYRAAQDALRSVLVFAGLVVGAVVFEWFYGRRRGGFLTSGANDDAS